MKHQNLGFLKAILGGGILLAASVQCEKMNISGDVDDANVVLRVLSFEQTPLSSQFCGLQRGG